MKESLTQSLWFGSHLTHLDLSFKDSHQVYGLAHILHMRM